MYSLFQIKSFQYRSDKQFSAATQNEFVVDVYVLTSRKAKTADDAKCWKLMKFATHIEFWLDIGKIYMTI